MTLKRKTQLNLSGSHRNLDADFAHIGSTLFVTGSVIVTGSMSSSGDLSTQGILRVQGATQLTGAVNLNSTLSASGTLHVGGSSTFKAATFAGTLSASNMISTANNLQVGQNAFVTGSLQVTGSIFVAEASLISASVVSASVGVSASVLQGTTVTAAGTISGSIGRFTYLSGALSASSTGLPFLVAGSNITANWSNTNLNWEITGSGGGGTPAGADRTVQFNNNGAFAGDVDLQFYSNSLGNIGANTLAFPSGNVGVLSGSNIDNQAYTLVLSAAAAQPIPGGPFPGFFDPAVVVLTPVVMSQSLMLFDGRHDPLGLGDSNFPAGGLSLANDARFTLYSGSWNPLPSDFSGKDPVVSIYNGDEGGSISVVGNLNVLSSSTDKNNVFSVRASYTAGQVQLKNVGTAEFLSGTVSLAYGSELNVYSGSNGGQAQFTVGPSLTSGKVAASLKGAMTITSGSLYVNSGSGDDGSFAVEPSTTAGQVNVIFDRSGSTGGLNFAGINVRPLYSSMTTVGATGYQMSGSLLSAGSAGANSIGKIDFNIIAVQKDTDNYGSWTFSTTVARDSANVLAVVAYSELDATTSGSAAVGWDVNINDDATIQCTGSAGAGIQWYAQITKKMFLSGSGLITY